MARPVDVIAGVGNGCHAAVGISEAAAADQVADPGRDTRNMHILIQHLPEPGHQIAHMALLTGVLLGNLEFDHHVGLFQAAEEGCHRLPDLEVHGAVLDLQDHVVPELSVHGHEVVVGCLGTVGLPVPPVLAAVIDKAAPDDPAAVGCHGIGQHVGTVGMGAAVGEGAGTALGIGLHQEAAEARQVLPDLLCLLNPPLLHAFVAGIAQGQAAQLHGSGEVDGEVQIDAVMGENLLHPAQFFIIAVGNQPGGGLDHVHIVDDHGVDAHRGSQAGVVPGALRHQNLIIGKEEGLSGVAPLDAAVHIVPVVQHPQGVGGRCFGLPGQRLKGTVFQPQLTDQGKNAIERAPLIGAFDGAAAVFRSDPVPFPGNFGIFPQSQGGISGGNADFPAVQPGEGHHQLLQRRSAGKIGGYGECLPGFIRQKGVG